MRFAAFSPRSVLLFARRRRGLVLATVAAASLAALPLAIRLRVDPNVLNLLPRSGPAVGAFRTYLGSFGSFDRVYVVFEAPPDRSIDDYGPLVDRYAEALRTRPEIARVDTRVFEPGKDWSYVLDRVLLLIGPGGAADALDRLRADDLGNEFKRARSRLLVPSPAMTEMVRRDPLNLLGRLRDRLSGANAFVRIDPTKDGYVSGDGRARLVIATPTHPPFDSDFCHRLETVLRGVEAQTLEAVAPEGDEDGLPPPGIRYAGGYHTALEAEREVRREAIQNVVASLAGILLLLLLVFRSPWLLIVGALPMSVAGLLSAAVNGSANPHLSAAAAGASALLFGLGIDGLVLLYARYLEERPGAASVAEALSRLGGSAASMLLGMTTSAATFLALTLVSFPALQELGRLIGIGMLLGGLLTLLIVPALLPATVRPRRSLRLDALPAFVQRHARLVLASAAGVTLLLGVALPSLRLDLSLQRLQPRTPQAAFDREVARRFGLPEDMVIVLGRGPDIDALLEANARLVTRLGASAAGMPVFGLTSVLPPAREQAEVARLIERSAISTADLSRRVDAAARAAGFRPSAFDPFVARTAALLNPSLRLTLDGYRRHGLGDLLSPYVARASDGFLTAAYARPRSPRDVEMVRAAAKESPLLQVTGLPLVNQELAARLLPQFGIGVGLGALAVFLLMWAALRSVRLTALALLPVLLGLVWSGGTLALLGVAVDLFSLFGVLAFIGIGVDYGVHLVHRYATEGDFSDALACVAPVNLVAAGVAVLGCGTLITSQYPPLRSLGIVSVVTLVTCLATSLLVLPATLLPRPRVGR